VAFSNLAGTYPASSGADTFDWGLPFYYGRTVYTAIEGATTDGRYGALRRLLIGPTAGRRRQDKLPVNEYQSDYHGDRGSHHGSP
jgi:hypothetical protein